MDGERGESEEGVREKDEEVGERERSGRGNRKEKIERNRVSLLCHAPDFNTGKRRGVIKEKEKERKERKRKEKEKEKEKKKKKEKEKKKKKKKKREKEKTYVSLPSWIWDVYVCG